MPSAIGAKVQLRAVVSGIRWDAGNKCVSVMAWIDLDRIARHAEAAAVPRPYPVEQDAPLGRRAPTSGHLRRRVDCVACFVVTKCFWPAATPSSLFEILDRRQISDQVVVKHWDRKCNVSMSWTVDHPFADDLRPPRSEALNCLTESLCNIGRTVWAIS